MKSRLLALLFALPLLASDPKGFVLWTAADLHSMGARLSSKAKNPTKFAAEQLDNLGNHHAMLARREGDGSAELHETESDIFVAESGTATLVVGGKIVSPSNSAPHEVRGPRIEGGTEHKFSQGDIVNIPAGVPHQLLLNGEKEFTYFVMKIAK